MSEFRFLEIGLVYAKVTNKEGQEQLLGKLPRLFLAIDDGMLITLRCQKGIQQIRQVTISLENYKLYHASRDITVGELCRNWKCNFAQLDKITRKYLAPCYDSVKSEGTRHQRQENVHRSQQMRTVRMVPANRRIA